MRLFPYHEEIIPGGYQEGIKSVYGIQGRSQAFLTSSLSKVSDWILVLAWLSYE